MRPWVLVLGLVAACSDDGIEISAEADQGGDTTVDDRTFEAFTHPAASLDAARRATFQAGRGPFNFQWEIPQLGPLFNNNACLGCHGGNGRGLSQIGNGALTSQALIRVSLLDGTPDEPGGNVPVPGFGQQLQDHAVDALPEVTVTQSWVEHADSYGDGELVMLREPRVEPRLLDGAPLASDIRLSYRQAPAVFGLGLLEAVPDATLTAMADPDDADGDGVSGRVNLVWDPALQAMVIGRFGHKATVVTLRQQTALAFVNDIGLTNKLFPAPDGMRDLADVQLDQVLFFVSTIAVPMAAPQNAAAQRGRAVFTDMGCASCHVPALETGDHAIAELAHQTIHPYTDLLIHDVGDLLTDARRDHAAEGVEWRTPPLWGLGLVQVVAPQATFLHDGRARTLEEAVLWHGGEAELAREAFRLAPRQTRDALIGFLQTL